MKGKDSILEQWLKKLDRRPRAFPAMLGGLGGFSAAMALTADSVPKALGLGAVAALGGAAGWLALGGEPYLEGDLPEPVSKSQPTPDPVPEPKDPELHLVLGDGDEALGDISESEAFEQRRILAEVESQLAKGKPAQAAQFLRGLLARQEQNNQPKHTAKIYAQAATLYTRFGLLEPAQELLERAVNLAPDDPLPRNGLAEVLKSRGELFKSERLYHETMTRFPDNVVARNGLAEVLKFLGELSEAERLYRETVTRFPEHVVARDGLAEVLTRLGRLAESEHLYRETVTRFPDNVVARSGLAEVLKSRGELMEPERLYRENMVRFPSDVVARIGLAEVLKLRGELSESEHLYRETVTRFPDNVMALSGLAEVLKNRGQLAEAEHFYRESLARFPENGVARNALAELLKNRGQLAEAEQLFHETLNLFPSDVVARIGLANLLRASYRFDEALVLVPEPAHIQTWQDFLDLRLRGIIFLSQGRLNEAERVLKRGLRKCIMELQKKSYRRTLAVLALRQSRWKHVKQLLAADTSPMDMVLQLHAYAGSSLAVPADQLARALQASKTLPFTARRVFEKLQFAYGFLPLEKPRSPSQEEADQIFELEIEMVALQGIG